MFQKTPRDYFIIQVQYYRFWTSLVAQTVKRLVYNSGDLGSIPGSGR